MNDEITTREYEEKRKKYQINRAKKYVKERISKDGSEPSLEWCLIKDLIKIIENLQEQNRELVKELKEQLEFLNNEEFECGCDSYNGFECGLCRRKAKLRGLLERAEGVE